MPIWAGTGKRPSHPSPQPASSLSHRSLCCAERAAGRWPCSCLRSAASTDCRRVFTGHCTLNKKLFMWPALMSQQWNNTFPLLQQSGDLDQCLEKPPGNAVQMLRATVTATISSSLMGQEF